MQLSADRRPRPGQGAAGDAASSTASTSRSTRPYGPRCLMARRLVERGVRFVQIFMAGQPWDTHNNNAAEHPQLLRADRPAGRRPADRPEAARPARRDAGLLGRRVRPHARRAEQATAATTIRTASASGWPAAASRAGRPTARPTTSATAPRSTARSVADLHATILHLLGLDHQRLTYPAPRPRRAADRRLPGQGPSSPSSPDPMITASRRRLAVVFSSSDVPGVPLVRIGTGPSTLHRLDGCRSAGRDASASRTGGVASRSGSPMRVVLAEKPSVARELAVLPRRRRPGATGTSRAGATR